MAAIVLVLCTVAPSMAAGFMRLFGSSAARTAPKTTMEMLKNFFTQAPSPEKQQKLYVAFNAAEAGVTFAQGAIQIDLARIKLLIAKLVKAREISEAQGQFLLGIIDAVTNESKVVSQKRDGLSEAFTSWFSSQP
jgi:hypothetical protein